MIVDNIEKLTSPIPCWKFKKIKTAACSFYELIERIKPVLYDGKKLNSVFPYNCDTLPLLGDFAVVLLAENMDIIINMEKSLKEMGVKRDHADKLLRSAADALPSQNPVTQIKKSLLQVLP